MIVRDEILEDYLALVRAFPLVSIKNDDQLAAALSVFEPHRLHTLRRSPS